MAIYGTLIPAFTKGRVLAEQAGHVPEPLQKTQFVCPIDGVPFDSLGKIQTHMKTEHPKTARRPLPNKPSRPF